MVDLDTVGACRWRPPSLADRAPRYRLVSFSVVRQNLCCDVLSFLSLRSPNDNDWFQVSSLNMGDIQIRFTHQPFRG